ncbi:hypothetical protein [Crassaminicella indica]|uniref:DUF4145 domain-containing protein n=1 Tax=Crassaminicella indica TaxID=2855394 RepID=A0ABX8RC60_9CLOT|nr:hypothetical protein [Crassaminicella indica]QXM06623.1 hypothetical protein KVH43_02415 [Crassaminicella indica]
MDYICNLDELKNKVLDEDDRRMLNEIILCTRSKAYRAAYIMTWICIAESIKGKIKNMSKYDGQALKVLNDIEDKEKYHKSTDEMIMQQAKKLNILNEVAIKRIQHIREMRHVYAHPRNAEPKQFELVSALNIAVEEVLSKSFKLRHEYVKELIDKMSSEQSLLHDNKASVYEFAKKRKKLIQKSAYRLLFEQIARELNDTINVPERQWVTRRLIWFSDAFFEDEEILENIKPFSISDLGSAILLTNFNLWQFASQEMRDSIVNRLLMQKEDGVGYNKKVYYLPLGIERLNMLYKGGYLRGKINKEKFINSIFEMPFYRLNLKDIEINLIIDRIIKELKSYDWHIHQNPAVRALKELDMSEIEKVNSEKLEELGRNILQAAEGRSDECVNYIQTMKENRTNKYIFKGIFKECFINEKTEFRFKFKYIKNVINYLIENIDEAFKTQIIDEMIENYSNAKPKDDRCIDTYSKEINNIFNYIEYYRIDRDDSVMKLFLEIRERVHDNLIEIYLKYIEEEKTISMRRIWYKAICENIRYCGGKIYEYCIKTKDAIKKDLNSNEYKEEICEYFLSINKSVLSVVENDEEKKEIEMEIKECEEILT